MIKLDVAASHVDRGDHREIMMRLIYRALVALTLLTGSFALAAQGADHGRGHDRHGSSHQGHDNRHDRGHENRGHRDIRHYGNEHRRDDRRYDHRRYGYGSHYPRYAPHHRVVYRYPAPRYVIRHDRWARGHRYYGPNYVVSNYGYYRLRQPPRGYHWIRSDNNYLLVAIATGVILDIALH